MKGGIVILLKRVVILLLCVLTLLSTVSCSTRNQKHIETNEKKSTIESKIDDKSKLKIYYLDFQPNIKNARLKFRNTFKDITLDETIFSGNEGGEEYRNKLATDLMAGEGPDIIIDNFHAFNSIHKVVSSGVFLDLNPLISKDKEFNMSDYLGIVMDYGVFDGKRYFVPFAYNVVGEFMTTEKILKENNINIDYSNWTWKSLAAMAKKFGEENDGKQKYLISSNFGLSTMVLNSGITFIDYENKKTNFNSKEFIDLLETYKVIYPFICSYDVSIKYKEWEDHFNNGGVLQVGQQIENPESLFCFNSFVKSKMDSNLVLIPYPTYVGGTDRYFSPMQTVGINARCSNPDKAFEFIKILLSTDLQTWEDSYGNQNVNFFSAVNKKAYELDKVFFSSEDAKRKFKSWDGVINHPLPENLVKYMDDRIANLKYSELQDAEVIRMIDEEAQSFIRGKKTAEQTARAMDKKVTTFLND